MKYFPLVLLIALMSITFEETFSATTTKKSQISVKTLKKDTKKTPVVPKKSSCDPNYSGCVPIASDVDCAGGGGDGPAYVTGPIRVIGKDIYKLDRDKDGIACE